MHSKRPIKKYKFPGRLTKSQKSKKPVTSKNVVSKIRKLAAKPTGGKNWCDLPYEMKLECMTWMDLKSKFRMRRTGRMEKEIFDQMKFSLALLEIEIADVVKLCIIANRRAWTLTLTSSDVVPVDTVVKCAAFLLKSAENINELWYRRYYDDDTSSIEKLSGNLKEVSLLNELQQCESFRLSRFYFWSDWIIDVPLCVLKKCSVPLKSVSVGGDATYKLGPILAVPQFITAKGISYMGELWDENVRLFHFEIAQKWIENDAPIGNIAAPQSGYPVSTREFAERFADRIVAQNGSWVRIRTDNPEKHILVCADDYKSAETIINASDRIRTDDEAPYNPWHLCGDILPIWLRDQED